ncbi:MAG: sigma-54-dependent Fis family transcriptional regulator, partial [bacterium]|nr:sigma-54-dependent Fis family transcriptional regulator [bacterium]
RSKKLFLPVNCAAIPAELFETELFGFEKGAFTGATDNYGGRFPQAHKGTLFLDEIGELPLPVQAKLLRVLDDNIIYRLKSQEPLSIDVRLITATNRNLEDEAENNRFRSDLYFRLKESTIRIPPLRERVEDILPLIYHYIAIHNGIYDKAVTKLSKETEIFFLEYPWPGNIRELKNTIKSIIPFKETDMIELQDLSHSILEEKVIEERQLITLAELERKHILKVLKIAQNNVSKTCEILGISRPRFYRKLKQYQLEVKEKS